MKPQTKRGRQTARLVKILIAFRTDELQSLERLATLTGYSKRTIRRDLTAMESEGVCVRHDELFWKSVGTFGHVSKPDSCNSVS